MPSITLKIPTLVQNVNLEEKPHYYLRPLFLSYPITTHRRYESAISTFQKEIKQLFKGYELTRESSNQLFWYLFKPEISYHQYELDFNIGNQHINGLFGTAQFELKNQNFITLPLLNNFMYISKSGKKRDDIATEVSNVVQHLLKEIKQEQQDEFIPELYFSGKREFITNIEVKVNINHGPFFQDQNINNWFFSRLKPNTDFDGAMEIDKVGRSLNSLYPSELNRAFYREDLVEKLYQLLFNQENTPIAVIGAEGIGKHTVIHEVVYRYMEKFEDSSGIPYQQIWHLDPTRVISGMSIVGMWQKRFESIIAYVRNPDPNGKVEDRILVDNPIALLNIGRSAQNNMTLSDVLKPYLEKRQLQLTLIGTTEEWKVLQEKDRRFSDLFQVIRLEEPDMELATKMILKQRRLLEIQNDTVFTTQAIHQLFTIHFNYLKNKALPGSIMKLMKQLAVKYRFQQVDSPEVRHEFETFSGLEQRIFDNTITLEPGEVHDQLNSELIGQPQAVDALSSVVHLIKSRLTDPSKPFGSFLFIGPTGVGKTQAAKILAKYLMGHEKHLLRFDMNEYLDEYAIHRLIGDQFNPEGQLTGQVRYHPFAVILFDEIEKAHPKIHDLLLQVLDDGRLTDSLGRTTDFSNTIIIMTSNLGAEAVDSKVGFQADQVEESAIYQKEVRKSFRPEFINRIDQIVIFRSLELNHILKIARLQIKELLQRDGFVRRTTILNISKEALEWVAKRGYDSKMGGRALKRQIEINLTTLSAEQLIATNSENPIIFNIHYQDNQLVPEIQTLDFIETERSNNWIPNIPDVNAGKRFYGKLLREIEKLQFRIEQFEGRDQDDDAMVDVSKEIGDWQYFDFKNKVTELKEEIRNKMLGFNDKIVFQAPAIPLRLKRAHLTQRNTNSTKGVRENFKDQLFQKEALKQIRESYQFGREQFDNIKSEFIGNFLNVAFLKLNAKGVLAHKVDNVLLQFESCITGMGQWEVLFLMDKYGAFFKELDLPHTVNKEEQQINVEGHGLYELINGEQGIHLFYNALQSPIPIRLKVTDLHRHTHKQTDLKVIRIYDGASTLTDLRTGLSNTAHLNLNEFKFLLYAGINEKLRKEIKDF